MTATVGIELAFLAMLSWGIGDFLIQKSTRKIGDWETLFIIVLFGSVVLLPFVYHKLPAFFSTFDQSTLVLLACAVTLFIAGLLDLEALREGKLAIIEPLWSFEIFSASLLAFFILREGLSSIQISLIILLVLGLFLLALKGKIISHKVFLEKGVVMGVCAALIMGMADFFMGWGARATDPLMVNFFVNVFMTVACALYLFKKGRLKKSFHDFGSNVKLLLPMSVADNVAWVAYAFGMSLAPIGVVTALSESSIIVAVVLGLVVNREKLEQHQKAGLVLAMVSALTLATITAS